MSNYQENQKLVTTIVEEFLERNAAMAGVLHLCLDPESKDHLIRCGVSVLMTKWGLGPAGGSFVQAVVANDLQQAVGRADSTNQEALKFYVMLLHNISQPSITA